MPGTDQLVLSTDGGEIGVAICADLGHPKLGRSHAGADVELLAVPASTLRWMTGRRAGSSAGSA